tara:strand:+ start:8240 stop:9820 length:1581 start_codon:yes stop_codon:yes gene_type:complete
MRYTLYIFLGCLQILLISCKGKPEAKPIEVLIDKEIKGISGENLAKNHCASCHVFPEPELLDKKTWQLGVLPQMGHRMGIYEDVTRQSLIETNPGGPLVEGQNIFPPKPILSKSQWKLIQNYYYNNAPDSLVIPNKKIQMGIKGLKVKVPEFHISPPMVTAIKYNSELNEVYVADTKTDYSAINILDRNLKSVSTLALPSPISYLDCKSDTIIATLMGGFMPTDNPSGSVVKIFKRPGEKEYRGFMSILKNLQRPVQTTFAELTGDHLEDIIVCEYGNHTGKLSLFIKQANGEYSRKILSSDPGAAAVEIRDLNQDGKPDIIVLMSQGNERIDVHYNLGEGNFNVSTLLRFPPSYGSVSFSLVDWNLDGHEDIIYVNGDNADFSRFLKPYHGLRIYLNDGENNFNEAFFQHQNGAYKAINHDFDNDGDQDIAMISFFPDVLQNPREGFIFLENTSSGDNIKGKLHTFEQASSGRWLIMEPTDFDQNNFPELLLGSFTGMAINGDPSGKLAQQFAQKSPTVMLLNFD